MSQLPAAIAIRLKGKTSFNVAMTVIEGLCAENAALRAVQQRLNGHNLQLRMPLASEQRIKAPRFCSLFHHVLRRLRCRKKNLASDRASWSRILPRAWHNLRA